MVLLCVSDDDSPAQVHHGQSVRSLSLPPQKETSSYFEPLHAVVSDRVQSVLLLLPWPDLSVVHPAALPLADQEGCAVHAAAQVDHL